MQHDGWGLAANLINTKRRTSWEPADIGILLNEISSMAAWENQETLWNVNLPGYHPEQSFFSWTERLRIDGILSEGFGAEANLDTLLLAQDLYYELKAMQERSEELFAKAEGMNLSQSQVALVEQARVFYSRYNFLDSLRYLEAALER